MNKPEDMLDIFAEWFAEGEKLAKKQYQEAKKIEVEYIPTKDPELEFTKYRFGIINYGRTLPF